jgi:NodT family efflux transporter outer membrane factor (OMF) lipoprotein
MHRPLSPFAWLLALVCVAGCTGPAQWVANGFKVGPNYKKPPTPVASHWIDADDSRVASVATDARDWWAVFRDPVLNALVQSAYQQNLSLKQAGFRVLEARGQRAIAVGNLFPQKQQAVASYSRDMLSQNVFNPATFAGLLAPGNTTGFGGLPGGGGLGSFFPRYATIWDTEFDLSWEADLWGRFRRAVEAADASLDASVENFDDVLVTLVADVATNYVNLRTLDERLRLARENVTEQRKIVEVIKERQEQGKKGTELLSPQMQSQLAQTEAIVPALETSLRQTNNKLCVLLGLPPHDLRPELGVGAIPAIPPQVVVGIPGELLLRRPDVRRAERNLASQSAQIGVAMADFYPRLVVNGTIGYQASELKDLFTKNSSFGVFGPSLTWSILNYGRILNNVRVQDARFYELAAAYQNAALQANLEAENALVAFLRDQDRAAKLAESARTAREAAEVLVTRFRENVSVDYNQLFTTQNFKVQQEDQAALAQGDVALDLIQLYRALGGGWQVRLNEAHFPPHAQFCTGQALPPATHAVGLGTPQANSE